MRGISKRDRIELRTLSLLSLPQCEHKLLTRKNLACKLDINLSSKSLGYLVPINEAKEVGNEVWSTVAEVNCTSKADQKGPANS